MWACIAVLWLLLVIGGVRLARADSPHPEGINVNPPAPPHIRPAVPPKAPPRAMRYE